MAHLNCLPPRAAGVSYWFFLLAHLVVGVGYKAKCEMLDAATQNRRRNERAKWWFFAKLRNGDDGDMLHDWRQWQLSWTRAIVFEEMTRCRLQKHCRRRTDNPNGPSKFCKYRVYLPLLLLFTSARSRLLFRSRRQRLCHAAAPSYFEETTHCRRQKLHWRWPGNPNGRSKFRNLGLFTFTRSQLTLQRRLCGSWQLPEIA